MMRFADELSCAVEAAEEAGRILLAHRARGVIAREKPDHTPVTAADLDADATIRARLAAAFPGDALLSEETPPAGAGRRRWLIDPLDGTRDFVAGSPEFAVHIALVVDGIAEAAAVCFPALAATLAAARGGGATVTSGGATRPLAVSTRRADLRTAVGATATRDNVRGFIEAAPLGPVARIGASVKMWRLAAGELEACLWLHGREHVWDACAPGLVVAEAGGRVSDVDGAPLRYDGAQTALARGIVATNGACHDLVLAAARRWFVP
jgi:3'(2'), 5'-bisphosphate nucleotidase